MPRNGAGVYSLPAGNPVVTGTTISSTVQNNTMSDVAVALTNSISKDGQTTPIANIPMGGFKLTNLGNATVATDAVNLRIAQNNAYGTLSSVSGTDTITAAASPALTAYANGQRFSFISAGANTGTSVTLNIDSLGAKNITKLGATALAVGDIPSGSKVLVEYDGTQFQLIGLAAQTAASLSSGATAVTQAAGTNNTTIATTAYVDRVKDKLFDIDASVSANALTVTINPCVLDFRSTTLTDGTPVTRTVSAGITCVVSSGSTLGTLSGIQSDIAVLAIDNAGTVEVAVVNLAGGTDLSETGIISTTAEGGAGGADSATVVYSTTARANVAYRVIGVVRSTQATAGTWATTPSLVQSAGCALLKSTVVTGPTVASTSGTAIDFTGIPAWVRRVTLTFAGVSTNGTAALRIQLGAGSVQSSGYVSTSILLGTSSNSTGGSDTSGFVIFSTGAANTLSGHITFTPTTGNQWVSSHTGKVATTFTLFGGGDVTLTGGTLDRVRVTTSNGTDTFDAGSITLSYE